MEFDREAMELLRPAADQLRKALQRMDEEDVPAPLRTLADSSARRLPPPILKRALTELDSSDWLRAETAEESGFEPGSAAELFVLRPDAWQERLAVLIEEDGVRREERTLSGMEEKLAAALKRVSELEELVKARSQEVTAAEATIRDRYRARIEAAERERREAESRAREEAQEAARLASRVERLSAALEAAESRLDALRQLLEKERRSPSVEGSSAPSRSWFPQEPSAMAHELDRIVTAVQRPPRRPAPVQGEVGAIRLPDGLRPDRIEVIHWLMRRKARWLIDGYNVAYQVADEPDTVTRNRLVAAAGRLVTLAESGSMVVVVFDSTVDTASLKSDRRVGVVYAPSADEWIISHAAPNSVAVTSDRRVREEAEKAGAIGVWSEALAAWIAAGSTVG